MSERQPPVKVPQDQPEYPIVLPDDRPYAPIRLRLEGVLSTQVARVVSLVALVALVWLQAGWYAFALYALVEGGPLVLRLVRRRNGEDDTRHP